MTFSYNDNLLKAKEHLQECLNKVRSLSNELFAKIIVNEARANDYFNLNEIRSIIDETLSGGRNFGWQLWSVFCLMMAL